MKKLLLALMCVSGIAMAEPVAFLPNNSDGRIVITNEQCMNKERTKTYDGMWRIYAYSGKTGDTAEGCFAFEGDTVRVFWPDTKQEKRYDLNKFELYKR